MPLRRRFTSRARQAASLDNVQYDAVGYTMLGAPILQPVVVFAVYTQAMGRSLDASSASWRCSGPVSS